MAYDASMVRDEDYSVGVLLEVVDSKLLIGWIIYELINMAQNDKSFGKSILGFGQNNKCFTPNIKGLGKTLKVLLKIFKTLVKM